MGRITLPALLFASLCAASATAAEIRGLAGTWNEEVTAIVEDGGTFVVHTPQRKIPLEQVKSIAFQERSAIVPDRRGTKIILTGGDALRGSIEDGGEEGIVLDSRALSRMKLRLGLIRAVVPETSPENERALEGRLGADDQIDRVRIADSGEVRGSIISIDGSQVVIDTDVEGGSRLGVLPVAWEKVELVSLALLEEPPPAPQDLHVSLRLVDGSTLTGPLLGLDEGNIRIEHQLAEDEGGVLAVPVPRVAEVAVRNGSFVYLSDLEPQGVEQHFPPEYAYEVEVWGFKRDQDVTGGPLRLGGRTYDKGLGVHSYCALTYRLDGEYAQLRAVVGLDDSTRYLGEPGFGAVVFRVLVDGKPAKEYPTGLHKRKGEPPTEIEVDLSGAEQVTLVADYDPTSLHVLGRADWADAHLLKKAR